MTPQQVAQRLPDLPRWVEARSLLLHDLCTLFGLQQEPDLAMVIRDAEDGTLFVVGRPSEEAVWAALGAGRQGEVIAPMALAGWLADLLPERPQARIIVYRLAETKRLPELSAEQVGFLDPARIAHLSLPDELREELPRWRRGVSDCRSLGRRAACGFLLCGRNHRVALGRGH